MKRIFLFVAIIFSSGTTYADDSSKKVISYDEYIKVITDKLPEIKKNEISLLLIKNGVVKADSISDTSLKASGGYTKTEEAFQAGSQSGESYSASASLSKRLAATGTSVEAGAGITSYSDYTSQLGRASGDVYVPSYYVSAKQSMLKNIFGIVDQFAKEDAESSYRISKVERVENDRAALNSFRKSYFSWLTMINDIALVGESIRDAENLKERVETKMKSGISDNADLQNSISSLIGYQEVREKSFSDLDTLLAGLNLYFDASSSAPEDALYEKIYSEAESCRYDYVPFEKSINSEFYRIAGEQYRQRYKVYSNQLLPELNLVGKYEAAREDGTLSKSFSGSEKRNYYVGFEFVHPLENTDNEGRVKDAELAIDRLNNEYQISLNSYKKSLATLKSSSESLKKIISLKERKIKSLESQYRSEEVKFSQARIDLDRLITTAQLLTSERRALLQSRNQLIAMYFDYQDLTVAY